MTTVSGGRATNTVHLSVAVTDTAVIIRTLYGGRAANIYSTPLTDTTVTTVCGGRATNTVHLSLKQQ